MKNMKRIFSLLFALVMVLSLIPVTAHAEGTDPVPFTVTASASCYTKSDRKTLVGIADTVSISGTDPITVSAETFGTYLTYKNKLYEFIGVFFEGKYHNSVTVNYGVSLNAIYVPHTHKYVQRYNRTSHWLGCACGSVVQKSYHVDPATDSDSICTCGYEFSHNANLVTLWLKNMDLSPRFNSNTTEYVGKVFTYKDVTSTEIRYKRADDWATVEVSGSTEIHEGVNVITLTVTAQDKKTVKTYTVYATKPVVVDGVAITSDGADPVTHAEPKATLKRDTASLTISNSMAKAMAEQADRNDSSKMVLEPQFSKWSTKVFTITFSADALKAMSEVETDLVIKTFMADVTIPGAQLAELAKEGDSITIRLDKLPSVALSILAGEKNVAVSDKIALDVK